MGRMMWRDDSRRSRVGASKASGRAASPGTRAVFLDRDGTIIYDRQYLADPHGVELLPKAAAGLKSLGSLGFRLAVVTNQSGVGRGSFGLEAVEAVHQRLDLLLASHGVSVDAYFICPHAPADGCDCRKPRPGLVLKAILQLHADPAASFMIGDQPTDILAGRAAGARTVRISSGPVLPGPGAEEDGADFRAADLVEAAGLIAAASGLSRRLHAG